MRVTIEEKLFNIIKIRMSLVRTLTKKTQISEYKDISRSAGKLINRIYASECGINEDKHKMISELFTIINKIDYEIKRYK